MADNNLDPVRVRIVVETEGAPTGDEISPTPDRSTPGRKPPEPGKRPTWKPDRGWRPGDDRRPDRDDDGFVVPGRAPQGRRRPRTDGGGGRGVGSVVIGAVKTAAGSVALSVVADVVPAMIDAKIEQLDDDQYFAKALIKGVEAIIGHPLTKIGDGLRALESALPVLAALTGSATDVARSGAILGISVKPDQIAAIAGRAAAVASAQKNIDLIQRKLGREGIGVAILEQRNRIMESFGFNK